MKSWRIQVAGGAASADGTDHGRAAFPVLMNRLVVGVAVVAILNPVPLAQHKTNPILDKVTSDLVAAFNAEDAGRAALLYAEDAVLMPANMPMIKGRTAIEGHFTREFAAT